ncbi:hypothetical protein ACN47E_005963 [Coniothyrium glycines]
MDLVRISALNPELPALEAKQFRAAVTLIWPYSSSARQFAVLLADPDLRLRRRKGQVRARFSGSSARAIAQTGVGIGDELVLGLRGAQFVQEGAVSTPGKSIDWELAYAQTLMVHVFRNGSQIASLDLVHAAPTPAPASPVQDRAAAGPRTSAQWSSPAIPRLPRLSGPFLFGDEADEGHDTKRRRTSYGRRTWTYSASTPSPDPEDTDMLDHLDGAAVSPTRAPRPPHTPTSPVKTSPGPPSAEHKHDEHHDGPRNEEATGQRLAATSPASVRRRSDSGLRQTNSDGLLAEPEDMPASDAQYAFGGDTEVDTEANTEAEDDDVSPITAEANTEELEEPPSSQRRDEETLDNTVDSGHDFTSGVDLVRVQPASSPPVEQDIASQAVMPPPLLPVLQTDFPTPIASGMLTPIGIAPASPTLQPLDSATLPLPSPFPGERDSDATSYLDHVTVEQQDTDTFTVTDDIEAPPRGADYILETSFFSSIGSSRFSGMNADHETVFTPVRFAFGLDGTGWSRPMDLPSSPAPIASTEMVEADKTHSPSDIAEDDDIDSFVFPISTAPSIAKEYTEAVDLGDSVHMTLHKGASRSPKPEEQPVVIINLSSDPAEADAAARLSKSPNIDDDAAEKDHKTIDNEVSNSEQDDDELASPTIHAQSTDRSNAEEQDMFLIAETQQSTATSEIIDLGSPSEEESDDDERGSTKQNHELVDPDDEVMADQASSNVGVTEDQDTKFPNLEDDSTQTRDAQDHKSTRAHISHQQSTARSKNYVLDHGVSEVDDTAPQFSDPDMDFVMHTSYQDRSSRRDSESSDLVEDGVHPDIKVESIEEASLFHLPQQDLSQASLEPSGELLIEVPEEGHKVGEMHTISVPATGPARNTRSKAKTSISPKKTVSVPKHTTRTTRSKTSMASNTRTSLSPSRTRTRSTASPPRAGSQTSPYNLRSQSKLLSPVTKVIPPISVRRSPQKLASQRSVDFLSDASPLQTASHDTFMTSFQPLQEFDASQGKYSNMSFIKDSEEESLHSEHSLSTLRYSDDWADAGMQYTNLSDPIEHMIMDDEVSHLKPPPASAPQPKTRSGVKSRNRQVEQPEIIELLSSSPGRRLRSAGSTVVASSNSQGSPRLKRYRSYSTEAVGDVARELIPKVANDLDSESEDLAIQGLRQSPQYGVDIDDLMRSSPPFVDKPIQASRQQRDLAIAVQITPENTQAISMASQINIATKHQGEQSLLTPDLTQATFTVLPSFHTDADDDELRETTPRPRGSSPATGSIPRRNVTVTDVASRSMTPQPGDPSSDADSENASNLPAVGFSTPLAYYTPLRDLRYFLNRSSQYLSSTNPDILALVTSASTPPTRAKKGPKHWNTTLHITDVSTYPAITTVNVFRAFQNALPVAQSGDIILLRAFGVKSLNRSPALISDEESSWCVWRYGKPAWGRKRGAYGELRAREEVKGPEVERGEGEWKEVEKLREWFVESVQSELEGKTNDEGEERADDELGQSL